jgi:cytochrome b6-f complex iron-sulfur subunit
METRRRFLSSFAMVGSLLLGYGAFASFLVRFVYPPKRRALFRDVFACRTGDLPLGESRLVADLRRGTVLLAHTRRGYRALSTVCTHLGCRVHFVADRQVFVCPCHQGIFDAEGRVLSGPPPRPLDRFEVRERGGMIYIAFPEA